MQGHLRYFKRVMLILMIGIGGCNNDRGRGLNDGANIGAHPTVNCLLSPNNHQHFCNYNYGLGHPVFYNYDHNFYINGLLNNYSQGFCGCGNSGEPVYSSNWGLGCIYRSYIQNFNNWNWQMTSPFLVYLWNPQSLQWTQAQGLNQFNNFGMNQCRMTVILACDTGVQGSCGPNAVCVSLTAQQGGGGYRQSGPGVCMTNQMGWGQNPYGW